MQEVYCEINDLRKGVIKFSFETNIFKPKVETNTTEIAELKTMMEAMRVQMQQAQYTTERPSGLN